MKNIIENVIDLCKKADTKFANLKLRNFIEKIVYDSEFVDMEFKYPVVFADGNRAKLTSAASRWSEAGNERAEDRKNPRLREDKFMGGIGNSNLRDLRGEFSDGNSSTQHRNSKQEFEASNLEIDAEFSKSNSNRFRGGFVDGNLGTQDRNSSREFGESNLGIDAEFSKSNSNGIRGEFMDGNLGTQDRNSSREFGESNLNRFRGGFVDGNSNTQLTNSSQKIGGKHKSKQTGFYNGDNQNLEGNYLSNDLDVMDVVDLNYKTEDEYSFPTHAQKTYKVIAGDENRTRVASLEGWSFTPKLHPQKIWTE